MKSRLTAFVFAFTLAFVLATSAAFLANGTSADAETLFTWEAAEKYADYVAEVSESYGETISLTATTPREASPSSITGIRQVVSETGISGNYDTYEITSDYGFHYVKGGLEDNFYTLSLTGFAEADHDYFYFAAGGMAEQAEVSYDAKSECVLIDFHLSEDIAAANAFLSADSKVLTLRFYKNAVTSISASFSDFKYTLEIKGVSRLTGAVEEAENGKSVKLTISDVIDTLGVQNYNFSNEDYSRVSAASYYPGSDGAVLTVSKSEDYGYYLSEGANSLKLVITRKDADKSYDMVINLPVGTKKSQITDEDDYDHNKFVFTIKGDIRDYMKKKPVKYNSKKVKSIKTAYESGSTVITVTTKKLYAYKATFSDGALSLEIAPAPDLYSKVIVLDAGHGGTDPGAKAGGVVEKEVTLSIMYDKMQKYLTDPNMKVYWTRKTDTYVALSNRAKFAKKVGADLFVSLHMNALDASAKKKEATSGTIVFYTRSNNKVQTGGLNSYRLAFLMLENLTDDLGLKKWDVQNSGYYVTKNNTVPAILVELGFITNSKDRAKMKKDDFRQKAAASIYETIEYAFKKYPTGR